MLSGSKTYIIAGLLGLVSAARYLGYIDQSMSDLIQGLLVGGGFAALRAGVAKVAEK